MEINIKYYVSSALLYLSIVGLAGEGCRCKGKTTPKADPSGYPNRVNVEKTPQTPTDPRGTTPTKLRAKKPNSKEKVNEERIRTKTQIREGIGAIESRCDNIVEDENIKKEQAQSIIQNLRPLAQKLIGLDNQLESLSGVEDIKDIKKQVEDTINTEPLKSLIEK